MGLARGVCMHPSLSQTFMLSSNSCSVRHCRFESELQGLRLRLAAEHEVALDRAEAARRDDRARAEERAQQLARWVGTA